MSMDKVTDFKKFEDDGLYGLELFIEKKPKSRLIRDIINQLKSSITKWSSDSQDVLVDFKKLEKRESSYYLMTDSISWNSFLKPEAGGLEISKVLNWWQKLLKALLEVEPWEKDWYILTLENLRLKDNNQIKLLPEPVEEVITKYNLQERYLDLNSYRPPEDINNQKFNKGEKTIVFSLGVIIYLLITGENPYAGKDQSDTLDRILAGRRLAPGIIRSELSDDLSDLINSCLNPDLNERPDIEFLLKKLKDMQINKAAVRNDLEKVKDNNKKKKQRFQMKQTIIYNLKQRWQVLGLFLVLALGLLAIFLTTGTNEIVTSNHQPHEVVELFYQGIDDKNVTMLDDTNSMDLGQLRRMVTETHVLETVRDFYDLQTSSEDIEQGQEEDIEISLEDDPDLDLGPDLEGSDEIIDEELPDIGENVDISESNQEDSFFGIESLELDYLEENDEVIIEANYNFFINSEGERLNWEAKDYLRLNKVDRRWQITGIRGFLEKIIKGEFGDI
ncbi:MAG: protein kinase domain-containing protein [Bacillota bacterium]